MQNDIDEDDGSEDEEAVGDDGIGEEEVEGSRILPCGPTCLDFSSSTSTCDKLAV